ncbi:MAG: hypothetical protein J6P46_02405 [Bacteroidales bacterium]|nr:hypothetical protein [Bacteroidales bacterium]
MGYEELKVYRDTLALLLKVSKLSETLDDDQVVPDLKLLKGELVDAMTCILRANEWPDNQDQIRSAVEHIARARIWIRLLFEAREISRYVYVQYSKSTSSIQGQMLEWHGNIG